MRTQRRFPALAALLAYALLSTASAQTPPANQSQHAEQRPSHAPGSQPDTHAVETGRGWQRRPLEELRRECEREPESPESNYNLGAALYDAKLYEESAAFLSRAARLDANFAAPRRALGLAYFKLARFNDAAEAFRQLTRLQPRLAEGHNNLGVALVKSGKHKEAAAALREAVTLEPSYAEARFNLGAALVALSEKDAAVEQHAALLALDARLAAKLFRLIQKDKLVDAGSD
jgi:tetratricopeptide (TPR) repeat protein